ncbi:YhcN/YlaJ family sporulation lipoprotein [Pontibacillus litoralis]|uniref:Sporulation protein n=1 Tax=Pontibacillus litoralis JSM 072002 TaxID=1385512 RepID=A0A0A5GDB3_9BACI|nr:YhcN/YlaJ family sporulation lipoprotein [Pontibacillus litoralis]KGX89198.1 hypothetical protein N784_01310 [Pontibacillus litoralis JSM 072002]
MKVIHLVGAQVLFIMLLAGCMATEDYVESDLQPEPLSYDLNEQEKYVEQSKDDGNIPFRREKEHAADPTKQTRLSDPNAMSTNNKKYDIQSRNISKRLTQSRYVKMAQVVVTHDKVMVAVAEPGRTTSTRVNVAEKVRQVVAQMPEAYDKEIVVYTDEVYWDRMKDLKGRINQADEMPGGVDQFRNPYR